MAATTCTITATITDPSQTSLLGNSYVKFRLRNFTGFIPQVAGTCVVCEDQIDAYPNPAGAISQVLVCNTAISPPNTFYTVEYWNQGRPISSANYYFNANTDLNTASNINPAPAPAGPSSIIFENNGVLNSSQTLLNLVDGANITIADLGSGNIEIAASGGGFDGTEGSFFLGPGITDYGTIYTLAASTGSGIAGGVVAANVVAVYLFELLVPFTISKATSQSLSNLGSQTSTFGIYSYAGALLVNGGQFTTLVSAGVQTNSFTPVTLPAGMYWHAQATTSSDNPAFPGIVVAGGIAAGDCVAWLAKNKTRAATASNSLSLGALPATLGTLTPFTPTNTNGDGVCTPLYE